jgi:predicted nucleic-acid-binding protein
MQGMSGDSVEVYAMLSALLPKVESCREALTAQAVGNALYGMQGLKGAADTSILIDFLYHQVKIIAGSSLLLKSLSSKDLVYLGQHLVLTLPVLQEEMKDEHQRWEMISTLLSDELVNRKSHADPFFRPSEFQSHAERRVYDITKTAFENAVVSLSSNEYLFNIFETDIVLRVPIANSVNHSQSNNSDLIINIEVDGIHHQLERKKRFCMLRDKYLRSQGVVIERIEVSVLRRMKDNEVKEWLLERVGTYIDRKI